jgi:hypothetical protein
MQLINDTLKSTSNLPIQSNLPLGKSGKIYKLANQLVPHVERSTMAQKHAAMLISGGKAISIGYNHDRMTTQKKLIMSYHAEVHSISNMCNIKNVKHLKRYLNDTERCMSFKEGVARRQYPKGSRVEK